jgi:hypothetical protein
VSHLNENPILRTLGRRTAGPVFASFASTALACAIAFNVGVSNGRFGEALDFLTPPLAPKTVMVAAAQPPAQAPHIPVNATVQPPQGIQEPTIYLNDGEKITGDVAVHKNSTLTITAKGEQAPVITVDGQAVALQKTTSEHKNGKDIPVYHYEIIKLAANDDGSARAIKVAVESGPAWTFNVAPDNAPTAEITAVQFDKNGAPIVSFTDDDDFRVTGGVISVVRADMPEGERPMTDGVLNTTKLPAAALNNHAVPAPAPHI